jgi:hypothetical protein
MILNDDRSESTFLIYLENFKWDIQRNQYSAKSNLPDQNRLAVMKDIIAKWSHFSEQEVSALKGKADLVSQVVAKYGLDQAQAQRDVDAVLKGRQIGAGA